MKPKNPYYQLREYKFYAGKQESKKISASQCGQPILQLYLSQTTEDIEQPNVFSKATIGSIAHKGMEHIITGKGLLKEYPMEKMLPNGWKITGTSDLIDTNDCVVYDYKFEANFAYQKHKKEGPDDSYNMQGAAYSWLYGGDFDFHIMSFITDHSPIKKDHPAESIQVTQIPIYSNKDFESIIKAKTNILEHHIATKSTPDKCDDLWWRQINGVKVPTRCKYYCQYSNVCPYYSKHAQAKTNIAMWG